MDTISQTVLDMKRMFEQRMSEFKKDLQKAAPSPTVTTLTSDFEVFKNFMFNALNSLQQQIELLTSQLDHMEMRSRRKILLVHGISEEKDENTSVLAAQVLHNRFKSLIITSNDLSRSHRMGRVVVKDKPRPLLVKFKDIATRDRVWRDKVTLKGSGITLSEFLTKERYDTFMMARKRFGITNCWTRNGFVMVIAADGQRHQVRSQAEFNSIAQATTIAESTGATNTDAKTRSRRTVKK